jgi:hypothetical protein
MPARKTPRPLRSALTDRSRVQRPFRDYSTHYSPGRQPSQDFDWDAALYRHARSMKALGYRLSDEQQARIDDHEKR